jgi:hypothetical protein
VKKEKKKRVLEKQNRQKQPRRKRDSWIRSSDIPDGHLMHITSLSLAALIVFLCS